MTEIKRYAPYAVSMFGCVAARMGERSDGGYVTYESHRQKMDALQSRLDSLESMQKRKDFDDTINDMIVKIGKSIHEALESEFSKKPKFTIKSDGIQLNTGSCTVKLGALDEIPSGQTYIKDAVIKAGIINGSRAFGDPVNAFKAKQSEPKKQHSSSLLCIKSVTTCFTAGESYAYGYRIYGGDMAYFLSCDDFVSDLADGERWELEDCGAYLMTTQRTHDGKPFALFKKP